MRIRPRRRAATRSLRRLLAAGLAAVLVVPAYGCRAELTPPGAPTGWPTEQSRHWQWQWQLSGPLDPTVDADVFLLDPVDTTAAQTAELRSRDRRLICQVHVGSVRSTDPDANRFPDAVRGSVGRRPDSRWLDVRGWDALEPVLADRFRLCRGKGFGAVALADADGYASRTGFPLDFDDQLLFNRRLARLARSLSLSPGLVNDVPQLAALAPDFDFAVNEECVRLAQCAKLLPFADEGKPVFHVEYTGSTGDFCVTTVGYGFASIRKKRTLDAWRDPCPLP
ncbi:endo alpha-1,4 polygalactosaminidase [Micromonospora sp. STR1_7]|uniref:Endo alpha-1,4 polygalactosaminidase n=1 Tax=Micromonospora parastrephiae TaxID=2806101 RepID=A0ABS1XZR0_9ACTN|nr:endo alpha-1,4 polygalactosaminidase [Micromonospora parastrephiae]MBM0234762.1 endo alpha-1,4 polygalactosaminidase [Micromonospora parastrephiae]